MLRQAGPAVTVRLCAHAPGLEPQPEQGSIQARTAGITASVLQRSDAVLFVLDARSGVLPGDHTLAAWLRAHNPARVLLVGNKAEGRGAAGALGASRLLPDGAGRPAGRADGAPRADDFAAEATRLGLGVPTLISAETGAPPRRACP